ncbi:unnamed protein product [Citrullus colocynthis]|uniref:Uncharacterized protein n=1 Tax=Citrullus colocynthis TaxID=252529 RepID=A0ABP0Y261_9ROSI
MFQFKIGIWRVARETHGTVAQLRDSGDVKRVVEFIRTGGKLKPILFPYLLTTMKISCSSTMEVLVVLSGTMEVLVVLNGTMEYTCNNTMKVLVVSSGIIEVFVVPISTIEVPVILSDTMEDL